MPSRPTPAGPSNDAVALVRIMPTATFMTEDPPMTALDLKICEYVFDSRAATDGARTLGGGTSLAVGIGTPGSDTRLPPVGSAQVTAPQRQAWLESGAVFPCKRPLAPFTAE